MMSVTAATVSTSETLQVSGNVVPHQEGILDNSFPCYISNSIAMPGQRHAALISQEMRKRALENIEERRRMAIRERCLRLADREEPNDGISLKFKFPDGSVKMGKFNESEPIQVLFDFIGQAEEASEIFKVQEATSCTAIASTSSGIISEQGIRTNSTFYVLWMSSMDVEEWISSHMENEQPQTTGAASELLLNPHGLLPSSPIPDLSQIPILIDDDDESEVPASPGLQTPKNAPHLDSANEVTLQDILSQLISGVDMSISPTSNQINV
ncbi:uncharacterized protein LOC106511794 [Austrofundulus limnaeus]|uniref:Uncharacterized protein LOC106511794 n=1 Tax=Austrofundulus limnaeus TaxID=52670 RepID=A0A2I4AKG8_AUSLI|nr:PREDICTED: uncharacterized protein LOC106511794 [Austrofundulus limnaeus]